MAPLTRGRSGPTGVPNEAMVEYYTQRAAAGLIITEATSISQQGSGWYGAPGIYTDAQQEGWSKVTSAVHAKGGKLFLQLWHMGRASHSSFQAGGALPVSASATAIEGTHNFPAHGQPAPYEVARPLETSEIPGVVQSYADAAARALAAGFDGVEIHSANGYVLEQFLQAATNKRTDQYGGSIENQARLLFEVVEAVTKVVPANRVGVRLSPNGEFNSQGTPEFRELYTHVLQGLDKHHLAYVHLMDGLAFGFHKLGAPFTLADARQHYHGALIGNCGYTLESAEAGLASGDADLVAFGRPFLANPDLVERLAHGWPLAPTPPYPAWYGTPAMADVRAGYTDFPPHVAA